MLSSKSLEILAIIGDLALETGAFAARKVSKICFAQHGGTRRAYTELLRRLEANELIIVEQIDSADPEDWVLRLTATGTQKHSPASPLRAWESPWDGLWRMLTFDLPAHDHSARSRLRSWLEELRFGKLQGSVWINHRSLSEIKRSFATLKVPPNAIVCMEGTFWDKGNEGQYVEKAWRLSAAQDAYSKYLKFLDQLQMPAPSFQTYQKWRSQERPLWNHALSLDPLLPRDLWNRCRRGANLALEAESRRAAAKRAWSETIPHWTDLSP
ncbi:hypothetical protein [Pelagicoccus sp. SDUM812005]|uniref:hypothetical protein n=1 Tax=Pelagicoccus sp. SDUM812005 TaxID=3041257 RepID=UPI00280F4648|nr:hypothetical protein [Pelagicoccus sp. SDUM812005]MDQ8181995.1 hypothetical protein [Pelagicoccus sp. SDUM812005]